MSYTPGPLPEKPAGRLLKTGEKGGKLLYSAEQMQAYTAAEVAQAVAAERERWELALRQTWGMVDPLEPAGSPGSYARGQDSGIVAALQTLRQNAEAIRALPQKGT